MKTVLDIKTSSLEAWRARSGDRRLAPARSQRSMSSQAISQLVHHPCSEKAIQVSYGRNNGKKQTHKKQKKTYKKMVDT